MHPGGQRGNAVAVVLVAILVGVVVVATMQAIPQIDLGSESKSAEKITSELELAMGSSMKSSAAQTLSNGFGVRSPVWFYNEPLIPSIFEVEGALNFTAGQNLQNSLQRLAKNKDYNLLESKVSVTLPQIEEGSMPKLLEDSLNESALSYSASAIVSARDAKSSKQIKVEKSVSAAPGAMLMHSALSDWSEQVLPTYNTEIGKMLDSLGYCQAARCDCTSGEPGPVITEQELDSILNVPGFRPSLDAFMEEKIAQLNLSVRGQGISCSYSISKLEIDKKIMRAQICVPQDETWKYSCAARGQLRTKTESAYAEWTSKVEQNPPPERQTYIESKLELKEPKNISPEEIATCGSASYKEERVSINPRAYVEIGVMCSSIEIFVGEDGIAQPVTARIVLVSAMQKDCPTIDPGPAPGTQSAPQCFLPP